MGGVSVPGGPGSWEGLCQGDPPPSADKTDACEIITLPQTSFAGGKYVLRDV